MAAEPRVVSLWRGANKQGLMCSGLLLDGSHILTVKHAFVDWAENQPIYVRLIDGVDGDVEARLFQRHRERDAALLELISAVGDPGFPALQTASPQSLNGKSARLLVIDPDTHGRSTPTNYSIAGHDHDTGEYVLSLESAKGYSGGVVEVDGRIIGLLSRRTKDDPLCRAVAMHLLWEWIRSSLGDHNAMPMHAPAATENRIIQACSVLAKEGQVAEGVNRMAGNFDVFLSHNSQDKPAVRELAKALRERGLMVWLDEDELTPGQNWLPLLEHGIKASGSFAVLVGKDGLGPWEKEEIQAALIQAVSKKLSVIPVLLPDASNQPELPAFLSTRTWVDLRPALNEKNLALLIWGITGKKSDGGKDPGERDADIAALLGERAQKLLAHPGTEELLGKGGFAGDCAALLKLGRNERVTRLIVSLNLATALCIEGWRGRNDGRGSNIKEDCLGLLAELIMLAVDKQHPSLELSKFAGGGLNNMFIACQRAGTAITVYCSLRNIPFKVRKLDEKKLDYSEGSFIDLSGLAVGFGDDAERDVHDAMQLHQWGSLDVRHIYPHVAKMLNYRAADDYADGSAVEALEDYIDMQSADYGNEPPFLVARGPKEWLQEGGLAVASKKLNIGLVIYQPGRDNDAQCPFLVVKEIRLINHILDYLRLLEKL